VKKPDDVLKEYQQFLRSSMEAHGTWRKEALEDFQLYAGNQWRKQDVDNLRGTDREGIVFNKVTGIVNAVCGSEVTNRYETRFIPRTQEDEFFNEAMTEVVRYIRQRSDVEHEESAAFMDAAICGMGCVEFWKDYSEDLEGVDKVDRVPVLDMLWDASAKKMNVDDGRGVIRGRWIPLAEALVRWPKKKRALKAMASTTDGATYPNEGSGDVHDQTEAFKYSNNELSFYVPETQKVLVHEYQRWYLVQKVFFVDPVSGEEMLVDPKEWKKIKSTLDSAGFVQGENYDFTELPMKEYWRGYFSDELVLEDEISDIQSGFTYRFISGFRETKEDKAGWFGLVKLMRDPQRWLNKAMSQIIYVISTNPKGAILAEKGVFIKPTEAMNDWAMPNKIIEMQPGAVANKQFMIAKGEYPQGLDRIMQISTQFVSEAVGVNPYFMGQVDDLKRTAGSAITSVQQQALIVLSVLFDSLKKYRKGAGRMHLSFIEEFMPEGTIVRIVMPNTGGVPQMIPFKREWVDTVKYDVIVDSAPVSHNAIREFWNSLQQTQSLELLMNAGIMTPDIIADTVPDVPTTIRERMKQNAMKQDMLGQAMQMLEAGDEQGVIDMLYQVMEQQGGAE
jgi:uncharacterized protein YjgD (DUF1641 family)